MRLKKMSCGVSLFLLLACNTTPLESNLPEAPPGGNVWSLQGAANLEALEFTGRIENTDIAVALHI